MAPPSCSMKGVCVRPSKRRWGLGIRDWDWMKLAVFDIDGTLVDHFAQDEACFVRAFADAFGIHQISTNWMEYEHPGTDLGVLDEVLRTRCGRAARAQDAARFIECYLALLSAERDRNRLEEIAGAGAVLGWLATHGVWRCAIATGGWQRSAKFKMAAAGLSIDDIPAAFAEDGPAREAVVLRAIERAAILCGVDAFERVVLLGDALWDLQTARRLRLPFVGVGRGSAGKRLLDAGSHHLVTDFLEMKSLVSLLENAELPEG